MSPFPTRSMYGIDERRTEIAPDAYKVEMQLRVAAVGGSFEGEIALSDKAPPRACSIKVSGAGTLGQLAHTRLSLEQLPSLVRALDDAERASVAVLEASGSVLTNKYSEGYPGRRYYEGQQFIDQVETIARDRARALFGVDHANVQPYSGSPANLAVYLAFAQPGDTVMGMALPMGGHLTHGWSVSATGKWFRPVQYGVRHDTGRVDLDEVRDLALKEQPKIIFCGGTAIPRTIDFPAFAAIAAEASRCSLSWRMRSGHSTCM